MFKKLVTTSLLVAVAMGTLSLGNAKADMDNHHMMKKRMMMKHHMMKKSMMHHRMMRHDM